MDRSNRLYEPAGKLVSAKVDFSLLLLETKELFVCGLARALALLASPHADGSIKIVQLLLLASQSKQQVKVEGERGRGRGRRERGTWLVSTPASISVKSWAPSVESLMTTTSCCLTYLSSP